MVKNSPAQQLSHNLLLFGPLPPPVGGATRNIEIFLQEAAKLPDLNVVVVNTSPGDYRKETNLLSLDTFGRMWRVLCGFLRNVRRSDVVLLFGRASFIFTMGSLLLLLNRVYRKPFFIKPFGGDLDVMLEQGALGRLGQRLLPAADDILVQTQQMARTLHQKYEWQNLRYLPGYREPSDLPQKTDFSPAGQLNVIFVGQLKAEKGIFVLLEALQHIQQNELELRLSCDFYGPQFDEDAESFTAMLHKTAGASYKGVLPAENVLPTMQHYDVLVLPTYFINEGHPGVLIEAMQIGLPVISTVFRAIGELITHGENGLLVPIKDSVLLAHMLKLLAADPGLCQKLGAAHYERRYQFQADVVIPNLLNMILPSVSSRES